MNRGLVRCVGLAIGVLAAGAVFAQIPRSVMAGMMRSAIRPPTGGGAAPVEFTWTVRDSSRDWTGAALSADGRRQTAVVQNGLIYVSTNYGVAWSAKGSAQSWQCVAMSADGARQTACIYDGTMYFSTDYGNTWTAGGESLCWVSVAMSADGARQTALEDNGYLYTSADYGSTWTTKMDDACRNWRRVGMSTNGQYQTAVPFHGVGGDPGGCSALLCDRYLQLGHELSAPVLQEGPPCPVPCGADPLRRVCGRSKQHRRAARRRVHDGTG